LTMTGTPLYMTTSVRSHWQRWLWLERHSTWQLQWGRTDNVDYDWNATLHDNFSEVALREWSRHTRDFSNLRVSFLFIFSSFFSFFLLPLPRVQLVFLDWSSQSIGLRQNTCFWPSTCLSRGSTTWQCLGTQPPKKNSPTLAEIMMFRLK